LSKEYWHIPDLEIKPGVSIRLRAATLLVLAMALLALWLSDLYWGFCLLGSVSLPILGRLDWRCSQTIKQQPVQQLQCRNGRWRVRLPGADSVLIAPLAGTVLLPWLVLLRCRSSGGGRTVTLCFSSDACSADDWRRLHLNLRQSLLGESG